MTIRSALRELYHQLAGGPVVPRILLVAACAAAAVPLAAASGQFRGGVSLVEVYASVADSWGEPVRDLKRADFHVVEDGEPQVVTAFSAGEFPLSVALGIDRSWSMSGDRLASAKRAAIRFLNELRSDDQSMVISIGTTVDVLSELSTDRLPQVGAIESLDPWGTTSLHDAIIASLDRVQAGSGRRALILLSDGDDRYSRATAAEALERARGSDVLIYPLALGKRRPPLFAELAVVSGGRSTHVERPAMIEPALLSIQRELRYQYLLGYEPSRPMPAQGQEWRSIRVSVDRPGVKVRARDGYLAR